MAEIADDLGVSPVYVETEVEFLEEYGFLLAQKDKFIANFIINEPSAELLKLQDDMYKGAAKLFANAFTVSKNFLETVNSRSLQKVRGRL